MNQTLKLNKEIGIDLPTLIDSRLLVQANSGGGKSWLLRRLLEQSHGKVQQIVIDLEGEFSTLREKYDYVLVGRGGDTPADPKSAGLLARKLLELNVSAIIDLYELPHHERKRFVKVFLESMVNAPKELWHPAIVVIDEAHIFCPEKGHSEAMEAVIDLATRGRKRGFCAVLATQRLSKLHKDAAAECNNKLVGRTGLDIDMKRAAEELGFTSKEQYLSLRSLAPGEFYAFGPAISMEVTKVTIGEVKTTHPKVGMRGLVKATPPTENIKKVLGKLADLPKEAEQEARTVSALQTENAQLKRELRAVQAGTTVDHKAIDAAVRQALEKQEIVFALERKHWRFQVDKYYNILRECHNKTAVMGIPEYPKAIPQTQPVQRLAPTAPKGEGRATYHKPLTTGSDDRSVTTREGEVGPLGSGERKLLAAIAQYSEGITREHLTVLTGYKRSSRDAYIQRLRQRRLIALTGDTIVPTDQGIAELGKDYEPLPSGPELREHVMQRLPEGEKRMLSILIDAYPDAVARDMLSEHTGYQRSSRDAYLQRLKARQLVGFEGRGLVKASEKLFV